MHDSTNLWVGLPILATFTDLKSIFQITNKEDCQNREVRSLEVEVREEAKSYIHFPQLSYQLIFWYGLSQLVWIIGVLLYLPINIFHQSTYGS